MYHRHGDALINKELDRRRKTFFQYRCHGEYPKQK